MKQIAAEWEAIVMSAMTSVAAIQHEPSLGGTSRLDIVVQNGDLQFAADIATISDAKMEDDNPIEFLEIEIQKAAKAQGLTGGGLFLSVGRAKAASERQRQVLALPPKGEIQRFVKVQVSPFLREVASDSSKDRVLSHEEGAVVVTLEYRASELRLTGGSWPNYTGPRTPKYNPLYGALHRKSKQLRDSGFDGVKGVIACDGGCASISQADAITSAFFLDHTKTVSFVSILDIPDDANAPRGGLRARQTVYWNPNLMQDRQEEVEALLAKFVEQLPPALSASQYVRDRPFSPDFTYHNSLDGTYSMDASDTSEVIKVSARAVLLALGGNLGSRFPGETSIPIKIFQAMAKEGRVIRSARIESADHADDDWLVLEIEGPDVSVAPFRVPDGSQRDPR